MKVFFETSVVLGAVQDELLDSDMNLKMYVDSGLIQKPERYVYSREVLDKIFQARPEEIEPFISPQSKREIRNLASNPDSIKSKILEPLRIVDEIERLNEDDRKLFLMIIYNVFMLKLPNLCYEIIDRFSSISADPEECEEIRDQIFQGVYRPLLGKYKRLWEEMELGGLSDREKKKHPNFDEYEFLSRLFLSFVTRTPSGLKFRNYKNFNDFLILAEVIYAYRKFCREMRSAPDVFFLSNDFIFIPFRTTTNRTLFDNIIRAIGTQFSIKVTNPKYMLENYL